MSVMKWVFVVIGVLFLVGGAALVGFIYWASGVPGVTVTDADLAVGGTYTPEEKDALLNACELGGTEERSTEACACMADKAGTELSRFLRLLLLATFEGSPTKVVAITKGLINSGVPQEKVQSMEKESRQRIETLMQACGLKQ